MFATILHRYAQIRDAFAKVLDSSFADSRQICESSRRIRDRFGQVRASSRKFAQVRASSRRIRGFATHSRIRASSRKFATGSRGFAMCTRKFPAEFAPVRDAFAAHSRIRAHNSHKFAPVLDGYNIVPWRECASVSLHVTRTTWPLSSGAGSSKVPALSCSLAAMSWTASSIT